MSYDTFLNSSLAKYTNPRKTKNEVLKVIGTYRDLRPKLEESRTIQDELKFVLVLEGTIPVPYKGNTYNTPIEIWISDKHPTEAPAVFVKPSTSMYIRQSKNVDVDGRVLAQYITYWHSSKSTLIGLITDLVKEFGQNPPLASFTTSSSSARSEFIAQLQLTNYMNPDITKKDAIALMECFQDIRGSYQDQLFTDGTRKPVLSLDGTMPVVFLGSVYNIPICICLMNRYPLQAPVVFVRPTSNMKLNDKNIYVDQTGLVKTPYIQNWKYPNIDLMSLLQELTVTFGKVPPVWNKATSDSSKMTGTNKSESNISSAYGHTVSAKYSEDGNKTNTQPGQFQDQPGRLAVQSGLRPTPSEQVPAHFGRGPVSSEQVSGRSGRASAPCAPLGEVPGRRAAAAVGDYHLGSAEDES